MKSKRLLSLILAVLIIISMFTNVTPISVSAESNSKHVDMLVTHDIHSHLDSFTVMNNGNQEIVGGFARMKTFIDSKRKENPDTLVLDAGDFSMGTLYQTLFESHATELIMMGKLGFDATTFGNHEFDYGSEALANMLNIATDSQKTLPQMLVCNVDWSKKQGDSELIRKAYENYGGKDYMVVEKGDVSIAILGVFGKDALECAPTCQLTFDDPIESVKETVSKIKKSEDVDMIVCLSHSGTWDEPKKSEDEILAKKVPELDVIISGHTHTYLEKPIVHGDTHIISVGEYGGRIGSLSMSQKSNGRWKIDNYKAVRLDDSIKPDKEIDKELEYYGSLIGKEYLNQFGYENDQVLFNNPYEFEPIADASEKHEELRLGNFMSDAYIYSVEKLSDNKAPVDVAVVPSGVIRETIYKGDVTVADIFENFSLGTGPDGVVGYPLLSVYLTGKELKIIAEIDASISDFMTSARLYMSGLNFTYNPNRIILNKVTDVYLLGKEGKQIKIENDKLYHVVADLYSGQMLSSVTDISKGILSVIPKDENGKKVENLENQIIYAGGKELKAWQAIAAYSQSFQEKDGIKVMPQYYETTHNRKVVNNSKNLWELIKKPNKYAIIIVSVVLLVITLLVFVIYKIYKLIKKIYNKKKTQVKNNI